MRVIGPESQNPEIQPIEVIPVVLDSTSVVDSHVGVDRNADVTDQVTPITGVTSIATPDQVNDDPPVFAACKGFRKRWADRKSDGSDKSDPLERLSSLGSDRSDQRLKTPSLIAPDSPELSPKSPDGPIGKASSSSTMADHVFLSNAKWSHIQLPWESPVMQSIFDVEPLPRVDLRQDISWKIAMEGPSLPAPQKSEETPETSGSLQPVFIKCVKAIRDQTFVEIRERDMQAALSKWYLVIRSDSSSSDIGRQIERDPNHAFDILRASMGVKSPNTVLGRANAMLAYMRWHSLSLPQEQLLPMKEEHAWQYVSHLNDTHAPPSRATSFVQACRFAHHVLGFRGAMEVVSSRRIIGLSEIQLADKEPAKQARPLTVWELQQLHRIAGDAVRHVKDRVLASHLLLMAYCRCRHSDTLQIEDVIHDHSRSHGYIQLRTRFHKGSKSAAKKSLLLPIVASSSGVGYPEWIQLWWENRMEAGLPVQGDLKGPLMPAPLSSGDGWSKRPLTSTEITHMLKEFLSETSDVLLSSHSMKATLLSWCAKASVSKEHRRLLGRHSSAVVDADSIYSRDIMYSPLDAMDKVIAAICEARFMPDAPRSQYWPLAEPISRTPVPLGSSHASALPMTPPFEPKHVTLKDFGTGKVKEETAVPADSFADSFDLVSEVVSISSDSDSESSTSEVSGSSSSDAVQEVGDERPAKFRALGPSHPGEHELWFQHAKTKTVHATEDVDSAVKVTMCGRSIGDQHKKIESVADWTAKCRVCFLGRRHV